MKQVSKASQLNKSVKQVSLASQVKQVGLASQVSNLPKSSQESEIKKVLVKQVQVKQVKSSKFKLSNLNQASEVMLDRDTAPRKRPSTRLSGKMNILKLALVVVGDLFLLVAKQRTNGFQVYTCVYNIYIYIHNYSYV